MKVRAKEPCYVQGRRRRTGDIFDYNGPPCHYLEPLDGLPEDFEDGYEPSGDKYDQMDVDRLRMILFEAGVKVSPMAKRETLLKKVRDLEAGNE